MPLPVKPSRTLWSLMRWSLLTALAVAAPRAHASESELEESPPSAAEEIAGQLERPFEHAPERTPLLPALRDLPSFLRDASVSARLRSRYLNRRRFDDTRAETWAGGGAAHFLSGWLADTAAVELGYFTSQRLLGDPDRDGALYLEPTWAGGS